MPLTVWKKTSKDGDLPENEEHPLYQKLMQDEGPEGDDSKSHETLMAAQSKVPKYIFFASALLLILSGGFFASACYILKMSSGKTFDTQLSGHTSYFSPLLDTMMPQWGLRDSPGHPLSSNESIWRQSPSDAVDDAWDHVTDVGMLEITRAQLLRLGKDPVSSVHTRTDYSSSTSANDDNEDGYFAIIDGVHLLHCLNSMRKSLYHNYHHYFPNGYPRAYGAHLSHCQEMLAQWLMCQPSIEFVSFGWYEKRDAPFPDFDITRKCIDYDQILDWQDEHRIKGLTKAIFDEMRPAEAVPRRTSTIMYDEILQHTWDEILDSAEYRMKVDNP
ncbi:hypothetical protein F5Y08DRAFT_302722 [Xylaria arbuscula]|nr:hypothetical protein F5Y08DRAFT_302722 [Xylaria arbuscula]